MSNTFKTNKARAAHKAVLDGSYFTGSTDPSKVILYSEGDKRSKLFLEMRMSGSRHGNNRKHYAKEKVNERRSERCEQNSELKRSLRNGM